MKHAIKAVIFESLVNSPKGFDLDPKRAPMIAQQLKSDPTATAAFYEVVGLLQSTNGSPAASALLTLVAGMPGAKSSSGGWGAR